MNAQFTITGVWLDGPEFRVSISVTPQVGYWQIELDALAFELVELDGEDAPCWVVTEEFPRMALSAGAPDEIMAHGAYLIDAAVNRWVAINRAFDGSFLLSEGSLARIQWAKIMLADFDA